MRYAFRLATDRDPVDRRSSAFSTDSIAKQQAHYESARADAENLLAIGESQHDPKLDASELAAWTLVTSTILNLDETITKN